MQVEENEKGRESSLLSNEHICFIFERCMRDEIFATRIISKEEEELKKILESTDELKNPIAKDIAKFITKEIIDTMQSKIDASKNGTSKEGKMMFLNRAIIDALEVAYYAITGRSKEDVIEDCQKEVKILDKLQAKLRS